MSCEEDLSDSNWKDEENSIKIEKMIKQETRDNSQQRVFRTPKFLDKWFNLFDPWLDRCKDDINKPFCKACRTTLDCNRAHLLRHEKTSKHARNLKIFIEKGEAAALQNFRMCQERNKYYLKRKGQSNTSETGDLNDSMDGECIDDEEAISETSYEFVKAGMSKSELYDEQPIVKRPKLNSPKVNRATKRRSPPPAVNTKKDRIKLFMQIQKDKNDLMKTFREMIGNKQKIQPPSPPAVEKNHVDLFFESVSSTVKSLSPKLIAEAKMRVQQLICELELRELTEGNAASTSVQTAPGTIIVSPHSDAYILQTNDRTKEPQ